MMFAQVPRRVKSLIYLTIPSIVGFGYFVVVISAYLPELGVKASYVGLILGVFSIAMIVASIPIGIIADRKGRKKIILFALSGIPVPFLIYGLTTNLTALVLTGLITGLVEAAFLTSWNALIADMTKLETRNAAFSLSFIVNNIAFGAGAALPFVFPYVRDATGWTVHSIHSGAFLAFALASITSPIMAWRLLKDYRETPHDAQKFVWGESMSTVVKFSAINSLIGLGAGFIIPLIPTWLFLEFSVPDTYSGPLLAVANVLMAVSAVASAKLAKRYGEVNTIVLTQGTSTIFMLILAFSTNAYVAASLYLVRTALMNMASPVSDSYLMSIISEKERGLASAINGIVWRLPNSVSTIVGGVLLAEGKFSLPFLLAASFYAVAITLFYAVFKDVKAKQ